MATAVKRARKTRTPTAKAVYRNRGEVNPHKRGYTRKWKNYTKRFKETVVEAEKGHDYWANCVHCLRDGIHNGHPSHHIDHIIPVSGPNDPLFWDVTNHQCLCPSHHGRKTTLETQYRYDIAQDVYDRRRQLGRKYGDMLPMTAQTTIVTGRPGSGKTTYCDTHKQASDIVFDLDSLAESLNAQYAQYAHRPADVAELIVRWRDELIRSIQLGKLTRPVWLIITNEKTAIAIAETIDAEVIRL